VECAGPNAPRDVGRANAPATRQRIEHAAELSTVISDRLIEISVEVAASLAPTPPLNPSSSVRGTVLLPIQWLRNLGGGFRHYLGNAASAFG